MKGLWILAATTVLAAAFNAGAFAMNVRLLPHDGPMSMTFVAASLQWLSLLMVGNLVTQLHRSIWFRRAIGSPPPIIWTWPETGEWTAWPTGFAGIDDGGHPVWAPLCMATNDSPLADGRVNCLTEGLTRGAVIVMPYPGGGYVKVTTKGVVDA